MRQNFLYTFLEELQILEEKALVCFATSNLSGLDNLEKRVDSRFSFEPIYFSNDSGFKGALESFLDKTQCAYKNGKFCDVLSLLREDAMVNSLTLQYTFSNKPARVFGIISGLLCKFDKDTIDSEISIPINEMRQKLMDSFNDIVENLGSYNYLKILSSFPQLDLQMLKSLIDSNKSNSDEITVFSAINTLVVETRKNNNSHKFSMANYKNVLITLAQMNL